MRFGTECPEGFLPVYSVDTEAEARRLIGMTCSLGNDGFYYSREMAEAEREGRRDIDGFYLFSQKLDQVYEAHVRGKCDG